MASRGRCRNSVFKWSITPTSIPRCPRMLAELRHNQVPVEVIANEHQFCHRAGRMGVTVLAIGLERAGRVHSAGNAGPDPLHQQVTSGIAHMGEAFDTQYGFLCGDEVECLVEGVRSLGGLT